MNVKRFKKMIVAYIVMFVILCVIVPCNTYLKVNVGARSSLPKNIQYDIEYKPITEVGYKDFGGTTFAVSGGAEIIDTPGFSSFDTDELGLALKERLPETFLDFAPYLDGCRFVGCSHTKEKGCAVLEAVRAGKLSASRHASYLRLYNELKDLREWSSK